ncbi:MAG: class I SAM-dependent methyltransferase [Fibrobacteria bacterium]
MKGGRNRGPAPAREQRQAAPDFWDRLLVAGEDNDFLEKTTCPSCATIPAHILGRLGPTLLRKCRSCSLMYISPRLATSVREDMLRREPAPISSERNLMLRHRMAEHMERIQREMPKAYGLNKRSASLLEVGCRWGHFLQLCRPHYRSVEGLEWSKERAAFARERFDLQVSATDIFRDPWEGRYNVIAAWDIVEREAHPAEFLKWAHDHLEPGGQLLLSTPNYNSLSRHLLRKRWSFFEPSRHLCFFTPATLTALLRKAGFKDVVVKTSGLSGFRNAFSGVNRVDRSLDSREQWLENLRGREAIEAARKDASAGVGRETALHNAVKRIGSFLSGILTAPGWGDEMRVYAKRS